jgi:hypothetical protein
MRPEIKQGQTSFLCPKPSDYCFLPPADKPKLLVVIDTEEEFDWSAQFSRTNTSVHAMRCIHRIQRIFDEYKIFPVYAVDYPVVSQKDGYEPLSEIHAEGRCVIGAHLHPWVNPPFVETVDRTNSFPGNLPRNLETEKLRILGEIIAERFGERPVIYKAGRYGLGPNTAQILDEQGFEIDLSVCPAMDYSDERGPNFSRHSVWPFWFGKRRLLELPLTVGFTGVLRRWGTGLHRAATSRSMASLHAPGILARSGLLNKIWLSPEGYVASELEALVRALYREGLRIFSFAFHSPSLEPGHTPYVKSQRELEDFLGRCRQFFDFFMGEMGGIPATPLELKAQLS